ncbi:MAG: hypothetical protein KAS75_00795 [Planctomycetes bacterium]|nr:hypothetical protein [Planctomycetota bacterium]
MIRVLIFLCCTFVVLAFSGCQDTTKIENPVEVIIEDGTGFPEFLVGTWRANNDNWEFVFEPDGTISSVVISLGRMRIKPGQITKIPLAQGGQGVFEPGKWMVSYDPSSRELTVKIFIKHLRMEMTNQVLEGKSTNIFIGKIDDKGSTWYVDWTGFPDYTVHTPEHPNFKLSKDMENSHGRQAALIFEKVAP